MSNRWVLKAYLLEKYGCRLTMEELAQVLKLPITTIYAQKSDGKLDLEIYKDGKKCFVDYEDVANYLDKKREEAIA